MKNIRRINVSKQISATVKRCVARETRMLTRTAITCLTLWLWACSQNHTPAAWPTGKIPGTRFTGGWVGPKAGLDRYGKFPPYWNWSPDYAARSAVTITTALPGPQSYTRSWFCVRPQRCKKQMLSSSCLSDIRSTDFCEIYTGVFY